MLVTTKKFYKKLQSEGYKCEAKDDNVITSSWTIGSGKITVACIFDDDNKSVRLVGMKYITITDNEWGSAVLRCNELNEQYRWVKFYVDKDNDILLQVDAVIQIDSCADVTFELLNRMLSIAEEAYPTILKAIKRK